MDMGKILNFYSHIVVTIGKHSNPEKIINQWVKVFYDIFTQIKKSDTSATDIKLEYGLGESDDLYRGIRRIMKRLNDSMDFIMAIGNADGLKHQLKLHMFRIKKSLKTLGEITYEFELQMNREIREANEAVDFSSKFIPSYSRIMSQAYNLGFASMIGAILYTQHSNVLGKVDELNWIEALLRVLLSLWQIGGLDGAAIVTQTLFVLIPIPLISQIPENLIYSSLFVFYYLMYNWIYTIQVAFFNTALLGIRQGLYISNVYNLAYDHMGDFYDILMSAGIYYSDATKEKLIQALGLLGNIPAMVWDSFIANIWGSVAEYQKSVIGLTKSFFGYRKDNDDEYGQVSEYVATDMKVNTERIAERIFDIFDPRVTVDRFTDNLKDTVNKLEIPDTIRENLLEYVKSIPQVVVDPNRSIGYGKKATSQNTQASSITQGNEEEKLIREISEIRKSVASVQADIIVLRNNLTKESAIMTDERNTLYMVLRTSLDIRDILLKKGGSIGKDFNVLEYQKELRRLKKVVPHYKTLKMPPFAVRDSGEVLRKQLKDSIRYVGALTDSETKRLRNVDDLTEKIKKRTAREKLLERQLETLRKRLPRNEPPMFEPLVFNDDDDDPSEGMSSPPLSSRSRASSMPESEREMQLSQATSDMFEGMHSQFVDPDLIFHTIERSDKTPFLILVVYLLVVLKKWRASVERVCCRRNQRRSYHDE